MFCTACGQQYAKDATFCAKCGKEITVWPDTNPSSPSATQAHVPPELKKSGTVVAISMKTTKKCPYCAEEIQDGALKCKHCGEFLDGRVRLTQGSVDELSGGWIALIWLSLFIPFIGGFIIIVLSSILYYSWEKNYPVKAKSINKHAWLAFICSVILCFFILGSILGISLIN